MANQDKFIEEIKSGYTFKGTSLMLGAAMLEGICFSDAVVSLPMRTLNRHGLIAGATGTGKTKTLQVIAEQLSAASIPVVLMDIKGDLSGIASAGDSSDERVVKRAEQLKISYKAEGSPVEFLTLSNEKGTRLRSTITEFGPVLFSKILGLNDTQGGAVAVIFKYCDDQLLPLLDLADFKKVLQYITNEGKDVVKAEFGLITSSTVGLIMRKVVELEQQGAATFFGERSFEVADLCRRDENGKGMVSVVRLTDIQDKPKLFSTFMLQMLAEIYSSFPEVGDLEQPELVIFIDEAHLVFEEASDALLSQIKTIIKLIRSKGVGIIFVTQNPADIPDAVLGQLGLKIQHALRAFTAKDRKAIKLTAENYPETNYYDTQKLITELGIGEAFVTALNEQGIPTPLVHTMLRPPQSQMNILTSEVIEAINAASVIQKKYNENINRESAYEILTAKINAVSGGLGENGEKTETQTILEEGKNIFTKVIDNPVAKQVGRAITREIARGILGVLGLGGSGKSKKSWF